MARIFLVDDDESVRRALAKVLARDGHEVTEFESGLRVIDEAEKSAPDLIISDIFMPDVDGVELISRLRGKGTGPPIIAISGGGATSSSSILELASGLGAVAVLKKPIEIEDVRKAVDSALSKEP